jgi:hypothetical protein
MYTEIAPHFVTISCRKDLRDLSKLIRLTPYRVGRIKRSVDGDKVKVLKSIPAEIAIPLRADMAKSIHKSLLEFPLFQGDSFSEMSVYILSNRNLHLRKKVLGFLRWQNWKGRSHPLLTVVLTIILSAIISSFVSWYMPILAGGKPIQRPIHVIIDDQTRGK